jgi:uncharacterized membrane protein
MYLPASSYTPQTLSLKRTYLWWLAAVVICLGVMGMVVGAPIAAATHHEPTASTLYRAFGILCHQLPERSYFIAGHKLAICSRCLGLYAGFTAMFLFYPLVRSVRTVTAPPVKWLFLAAVPLGIDFSLTFFGIWENTHTSRLVTGLLLGGVAVLYVMPGISELSLRGAKPIRQSGPTFTMVSPEEIASAASDYKNLRSQISNFK